MATQSDIRSDLPQVPSGQKRGWRVAAVALAVVAALLLGLLVSRMGDTDGRIEREHGIDLPASATELQALGDASMPVLSLVQIDRGASSIFVIKRDDLDDLFAQFVETNAPFGAEDVGGPPAPSNAVYQPDSVPWPEDAEVERTLFTFAPPSSADFAQINAYTMDDPELVGIWIYSDWN